MYIVDIVSGVGYLSVVVKEVFFDKIIMYYLIEVDLVLLCVSVYLVNFLEILFDVYF